MGDLSIDDLGGWRRTRVLGCGGFGLVTLYRNENTNELIAIKCLREKELAQIIKPKHKERWRKEVEIMHKLHHDNIVAALPVPAALLPPPGATPLLAMEFCTLGDLRQLIVKSENCCGLSESTARDVLRDVSNGLNYLHSCKVIHRDLKPDNIMLQDVEGRVVYKLIDLGYAKELDQGSLCESFVGTVQYLAPELFMGKPYTCSVDYWSFGQVAHEIITGHRPFLPGLPPVVWMKEIQNKKRSVISVVQTWSGDTIHSSSLSKVNHLSSCLREDFEKWLQLALDWDGSTRGRYPESKEMTLFSSLSEILEKRVVRVFSMPTCEVLSFNAVRDSTVRSLQFWIRQQIGLETDNQILLLPDGKSLNPNASLLNSLPAEGCSEQVAIHLYSAGLIKIGSKPVLRPLFVRELLDDPKRMLVYSHLKRSSSDAVFVLQAEVALYKHIIASLNAKVANITQKLSALETLLEDVQEEWSHVEAFSQFFVLSHKTDLESYIELRKAGGVASKDLVQKWVRKAGELDAKLNQLRVSNNWKEQKAEVDKAKTKAAGLSCNSLLTSNKSSLDDLLAEGIVLFEKVRNIPKDVQGLPMSNTDMVRVLLKAMEASAKLLKHPDLVQLFQNIFDCEDAIAKLISPLTVSLKSAKMMRQVYDSAQKDRQRDIWGLLMQKLAQNPVSDQKVSLHAPKISADVSKTSLTSEKPVPQFETSLQSCETPANPDTSTGKWAEGDLSPFHIPRTVRAPVSPMDENMLRVDFRVAGPVSLGLHSLTSPRKLPSAGYEESTLCLPRATDVIQCSLDLRHRTETLAQSCHEMVQDIRSLNWDFLNDVGDVHVNN